MLMNWDDVRYFLALCREGSVSAAGESLEVTHTTVARRVTGLEKELGTRLFDRTAYGYAMTQAAENMFEHAVAMEVRAHSIDREVFGQDAELRGPLKLTMPYDLAEEIFVPALPAFRKAYPCIDLDLISTTGLVDLAAREADIAVRVTAEPPEYLVGRRVVPLRHGVYAAPRYLKQTPDPAKVILFRGEREMPEWCRQHFPKAEVVLRTDELRTMNAAVREGMGLARMPCFMGDSESKIRRLDLELKPSTWSVWVLSHVDLRSTARVRVCREFLIEVIESKRKIILGEASSYA